VGRGVAQITWVGQVAAEQRTRPVWICPLAHPAVRAPGTRGGPVLPARRGLSRERGRTAPGRAKPRAPDSDTGATRGEGHGGPTGSGEGRERGGGG